MCWRVRINGGKCVYGRIASLHVSSRQKAPPREENTQSQYRTHANPAWPKSCSWLLSRCRKLKWTKWGLRWLILLTSARRPLFATTARIKLFLSMGGSAIRAGRAQRSSLHFTAWCSNTVTVRGRYRWSNHVYYLCCSAFKHTQNRNRNYGNNRVARNCNSSILACVGLCFFCQCLPNRIALTYSLCVGQCRQEINRLLLLLLLILLVYSFIFQSTSVFRGLITQPVFKHPRSRLKDN